MPISKSTLGLNGSRGALLEGHTEHWKAFPFSSLVVLLLSCKIFCKAAWRSGERMGCGAGVLPALALRSPVFSCSICPCMKRGWTTQFGIRQRCGVAEEERLECCWGLGHPVGSYGQLCSGWDAAACPITACSHIPAPITQLGRAEIHHRWVRQSPVLGKNAYMSPRRDRCTLNTTILFYQPFHTFSPTALCLSHSFRGLLQGFICL